MYTERVTKRMLSRGSYFYPFCKNEIEDESRVLFTVHITFLKYVNTITTTVQDTPNALSRVMAGDDQESIIKLSCFLYRVFDMRNRAV